MRNGINFDNNQRHVNIPDPAVLAERLIVLAEALNALVESFEIIDNTKEDDDETWPTMAN